MNSDGYPLNSAFPDGITADALVSLDETANIALGSGEINLNAAVVLVNGNPISGVGGFVVNPMAIELNANDYDILNAGAILATSFVKNGGTSQQYLMGDGSSLQYSANSGNSNFYLYYNEETKDPAPPAGYITYNAALQDNATLIYISYKTRDNIDIQVFFKNLSSLNLVYLQTESSSANSITYDITGPPTIVNNAQITIPVIRTASTGTGATSFGIEENILLSFFTNSIETDGRITTLEAKTQNIAATPNDTTISGYATVILREAQPDFFLVKGDGNDLKFTVGRTSITCGENMNMSNKLITALGPPVSSSDAARKVYVDDLTTPLQTKTQNLTATASETVFDKNSSFVLRVADSDSFVIRNDDSPASVAKFIVSNTSAQIQSVPLLMNNQKITLLAEPTISTDAATKNYVDTADALKLNLTGGTLTGNLTAPSFIKTGGLISEFLKANGSVDNSTYLKADGTVAMTGALNMGTQTITNAGSITGTSFVKTGGTATQLLLGNGTTIPTTTFTTMVSNTFTATFGTVANAVFTYKYVFDGTSKIVTLGIPFIRSTITGGPLALFSSTTTALPAIIRPATTSVSSIRIVVNNVFEAGYIELTSAGLISFAKVSATWANNANGNGSGNGVAGDYMYITYVA